MSEHCQQIVYVRDTYRYSGRSRGGFSMHYTRRQCRRVGRFDGYCWQHRPVGGYISRVDAEKIVLDMMTPPVSQEKM